MQKHMMITYLHSLQSDIKVLARTKQDSKKLCDLRQKRDEILSQLRVAKAVKSMPKNFSFNKGLLWI